MAASWQVLQRRLFLAELRRVRCNMSRDVSMCATVVVQCNGSTNHKKHQYAWAVCSVTEEKTFAYTEKPCRPPSCASVSM